MKKWTEKEENLFIQLYPMERLNDLVDLFGRSAISLKSKAHKLGIIKKLKEDGSRPYTEDEKEYIRYNYGNSSPREIAEKLGRTRSSVVSIAETMKVKSNSWWTDDQVIFLKDNYNSETPENISLILNKKWRTITKKARELGLKRFKSNGKAYTRISAATEEEIVFIKDNSLHMSASEIAKKLNRSITFVEFNCKKLNIELFRSRKDISNFSDDTLLQMLLDLEKRLGRSIIGSDLLKYSNFPDISIYYDRFGSFSNALLLSGTKYDRSGFYGRRCLSSNGDKCDSISERIICDFMDNKNIAYKKDLKYKDVFPSIKENYRMDWLLENNIVVEFFGIMNKESYRNKTTKKINLCNNNSIKLIEIYYSDLNKLEELFKDYIQ